MTEYEYVINSTDLKQRYDRIIQIITALENQQLLAASNCDVQGYTINDGQIQISTQNRNPEQISKAINAYEKIATRLMHQITGTRVVRLADASAVQSNGTIQRF